MKFFLILIALFFISCENKMDKECEIDFKISKNNIYDKGIVSKLEFHGNKLKISVINLRKDTLYFLTPHFIFSKETKDWHKKEDLTGNVIKQYIPNIFIDRVTIFCTFENERNKIIDSSRNNQIAQQEFKLAPKEKYIAEYIINCEESDPEKYEIVFFNSNRFDSCKYERIKYPKNGFITVKNKKYGK